MRVSGGWHQAGARSPVDTARGVARPSLLIGIALAIAVVLVSGAALTGWTWPVDQPLAFNHQLHIGEVGLECIDCHQGALDSVRATIPNIEVCADCHEEVVGESAAEAKLVEHVSSGERIPWRKVYRVPDHVFFSHRRHAALAGLECEVCHGSVGERVEPVSRPHRRPTMNDCMACHAESGVSNDCIYCHY